MTFDEFCEKSNKFFDWFLKALALFYFGSLSLACYGDSIYRMLNGDFRQATKSMLAAFVATGGGVVLLLFLMWVDKWKRR